MYYYEKKPTHLVCLFGFEKKKKTGFIQTPCSHIFQISTAEPSAIMYLYRNLLIAKNCMVDGRLHELLPFKLWINYNTVASFKKRNPCFHLHQGFL